MCILFSACSINRNAYVDQMYALDTIIEFSILDSNKDNASQAVNLAKNEISRLEKLLSISGNSDISKLNNSTKFPVEVSNETCELINKSIDISRKTNGDFDITIYPIMSLWGFDNDKYVVPNDNQISDVLKSVSYENVQVEKNHVSLKEKCKIDLGGIAKGYITQKAVDVLKKNGIKSALINCGGNVYALGTKLDNSMYNIGIQDPDYNSDYFGKIRLQDQFAITSGAYQRYFKQDGKIYHHIMDPKTGKPSNSDICSVTIVGVDGTLCDAYSTALFVMGKDKAIEYKKNSNDNFDFVILTKDRKVYVTTGLKDYFSLNETYSLEVIYI